jgi:signal transduction histidine kinase
MLERLLENLVSNAVKYTRQGGVSVAFAGGAGGDVRIEVHDTGIGIPEKYRTRLFDEFFRAENAKEVEEIGTGLGLTIVREIAEKHGGRVEVESVPGKGSTFTVHLPAGVGEEQS